MKVLVIGIDGASPLLVEKWIEDLPTFRKIKKQGWFGTSVPPVPAQTPVAWTTFMTGKNPGKHGVFSFITRRRGTYERQIADPTMIRSKTLWSLLGERGKRTGLVNVPMSDVEKLEGFIVPGFLSRTEGIPYPQHVREAVEERFGKEPLVGDVETEVLKNMKLNPERFFERVHQITDKTAQFSRFLAQREDWDFFMTVFMGADRVQHFFWRHVDPAHQKYEENQFTELVKEYYVKIDSLVDEFLGLADEETLTIVLSDHGFCPVNKELVVNNYLKTLGFLNTKDGKVSPEESKAVSYGYGDIWINVKGREPHGKVAFGEEYEAIRDKIIEGLREARVNGEAPIKDVRRREAIYSGDQLESGPDLVAIFKPGWQAARHPEIMKQHEEPYVNSAPMWSGGHDGTHDPADVHGILGLMGSDLQGPEESSVHLSSLTPTILQLMDIPIPEDMDGRPMRFRSR